MKTWIRRLKARMSPRRRPGSAWRSTAPRAAGQPVVLVLAAGRGQRFTASGGRTHKLDALLAGQTVLQHTLNAVRASGLPWHLERGPHPGMGDSIAAAVRHTRDAVGWLVLPGDLPLIQPHTLQAVAQALMQGTPAKGETTASIARTRRTPGREGPDPRSDDQQSQSDRNPCVVVQPWAATAPGDVPSRGHPVGFGRGCGDQLSRLRGDEGARTLMPAHVVRRLVVDDAGCVLDVDTVEALQKAEQLIQRRRGQ